MTSSARTRLLAVSISALVLVTLTGCGLLTVQAGPSETAQSAASEQTEVDPEALSVDASMQPAPGASATEAAAQLIEIHRDLLESERFDEACLLYRAEFAQQLADLAGVDGSCADVLYQAFIVQTEEAFQAADELGEMPMTPAFFVPSAITIDSAQITADEDWLAYVPSAAVTSLDPMAFREGAGLTPAWLARSFYVQQGEDNIWRFAGAGERDDRAST